MYYCKNCHKLFDKLVQYPTEDKMFQICPHCKSENVMLENQLSEEERLRILRELKLERILGEKNNILVTIKKLIK